MLARHVTYEKQCLMCKVVSGIGFTGFGAFNIWRASNAWRYMGFKDKVFNFFAIGVIFGIAAMNFNAGYQIHLGKNMELIELRPSYSARFYEAYNYSQMNDEEKREYLKA